MIFEEGIMALERMGLSDVILPFLLIFTIVFAILQKIKVFGKDNKKINVVVALVLALAVIVPHVTNSYPYNGDIVDIINKALPNVTVVIVAIIMVLILAGVFGVEVAWAGQMTGVITIAAFGIILFIFGRAAGWFERIPNWLRWIDNTETQALLIVLLIFGIIISFITKEDKNTDPNREKGLENLGKFFKKIE